jgi:23S rRNA (guanosine2251-2'-O)-methyltransferase
MAHPRHDEPNEDTILEGRTPIAEALKAGRSINRVFVLESVRGKRNDPLQQLADQCREHGAIVDYVGRKTLNQMATSHGHQGIIAHVAPRDYADLADILTEHPNGFLLLLDHIQDAHNLGSILRIADGAGVDAVVIPKRRSVPLNATVAKASAGAVEHVPICRVNNLTQTILDLKQRGYWIYGTAADGGMNYDDAQYDGPIALIVGNEGRGMGQKIEEHCDFLLTIPLHGEVNSLNAAVACGIVTFEAAKKRRQRGELS